MHGLTLAAIRSPSRSRHLAHARQEFWWRARRETDASYPKLGRFTGNRDHTTVIYGERAHAKRLENA